jgi:hypothetical protein
VSAWRRKAIALFPEHRAEWTAPEFPLREVFHRLESDAADHHARWARDPDDAEAADFLERLYGFAEWCLHQAALWNDAAIGFLEDISHAVPFDALVPWLSPAMREAVEQTWALGVDGRRRPKWQRAIEGCTLAPWRRTVYQTNVVQEL